MNDQFNAPLAERRMELVFEHSSGMLTVISPDFRILRSNKKLLSAIKQTEEVIGRHCYEVYQKRDFPCEICAVRTVMETGLPTREELSLPLPDGSLLWFDVNAFPLRDDNGNIVEIVEMAIDITERKKVELALQESKGRFQALAASTASAILVIQNGRMVYANPAAGKITGYSWEDDTLMSFWNVIHPDSREQVKRMGEAREHGEEVPERYELKIIQHSGAEIWVDISAGVMTWKGKPAVITSFFDITARKELEERLRKLSTAVEQSANTIVITDTDGNLEYVNPKFTELTGYTTAEAIGQNPRILNARTQAANYGPVYNFSLNILSR